MTTPTETPTPETDEFYKTVNSTGIQWVEDAMKFARGMERRARRAFDEWKDYAQKFEDAEAACNANCLTIATLTAQLEEARRALKAHNYYWPRRRSAGGGQALSTLTCGHVGSVGAPCCKDCAKEIISKALAAMTNQKEEK